MMRTMQLMLLLITQILVVPYIEDNDEAVAIYNNNPLFFWKRWFDVNDEFHKIIPALVVDGAHRHFVSLELMLVLWLHRRSKEAQSDAVKSCRVYRT